MQDPTLNPETMAPTALASSLKASLSEIRRLLIHAPATVSPLTAGPVLERISQDLIALSQASVPARREDLLEIQALSRSVNALYRSASSYFNGLTAESIKNGAWDAASYAPDGEWVQPMQSRLSAQG